MDLRVAEPTADVGDTVVLMVRPERVVISQAAGAAEGANTLRGRVVSLTFRGANTCVVLDCRGLRVEAEIGNVEGSPPEWLREGSEVTAQVSPDALHVLGDG